MYTRDMNVFNAILHIKTREMNTYIFVDYDQTFRKGMWS